MENTNNPHKKARSNPVYITPVIRQVYNSESSDELPEGDAEYKPASKKKRQRKRKTPATKSKDDDDIAVLDEKITPKTKIRLMQNKIKIKSRTSSVQDIFRRLAEFSKSVNTVDAVAESEDDSDLTCSVCMSSFWYSRELEEHVRTAHGLDKQGTGEKLKTDE